MKPWHRINTTYFYSRVEQVASFLEDDGDGDL